MWKKNIFLMAQFEFSNVFQKSDFRSVVHIWTLQLAIDTWQAFEFSDVFQRSYFRPVVRRLDIETGRHSAEHLQPPLRSLQVFSSSFQRWWQIQNCVDVWRRWLYLLWLPEIQNIYLFSFYIYHTQCIFISLFLKMLQ